MRIRPFATAAALVGVVLLPGCGPGPGAAPMTGERRMAAAQFTLGVVPAPTGGLQTSADTAGRTLAPIRLLGRAYVPQALDGVANVQDGYVSGSAVRVFDATSGHMLAQTVTYYDGSFLVDIPLKDGQRAVLITSELVGRGEAGMTIRLMAPTLLVAGTAEQRVVLSPGSTALVAFLSTLAIEQGGQMAPEAVPPPSLEGVSPDHVSSQLSGLIAVFSFDAQARFAQLAESAPELQGAVTVNGLQKGIQRYVGRLTRSAVKTSKP